MKLVSSTRSFAKDVQGTVEGLEDPDGTSDKNERYALDPYGALENENQLSAEAKANPVRFQGFTYDSASDLYDMQARHYRPEVGRFLTRDRYESSALDVNLEQDPLTNNMYAFAGGNPVSNVEFDGHHICDVSARKTDATRSSCERHNKHLAEGKAGYHKGQNCTPILCPNHLGQYPTFQQNRSAMLNSKHRTALNNQAPILGSPFPMSEADHRATARPAVPGPGGRQKLLPAWADEAATVFNGGLSVYSGSSEAALRWKTQVAMTMRFGATREARSAASGYMRMFKKFGGVANNKYVIFGARVVPVLGLVAGTLTDHYVDGRGWMDAVGHSTAQAVGSVAGGLIMGAVGCSAGIASGPGDLVVCPSAVIAGGIAGQEGVGQLYDQLLHGGKPRRVE